MLVSFLGEGKRVGAYLSLQLPGSVRPWREGRLVGVDLGRERGTNVVAAEDYVCLERDAGAEGDAGAVGGALAAVGGERGG